MPRKIHFECDGCGGTAVEEDYSADMPSLPSKWLDVIICGRSDTSDVETHKFEAVVCSQACLYAWLSTVMGDGIALVNSREKQAA